MKKSAVAKGPEAKTARKKPAKSPVKQTARQLTQKLTKLARSTFGISDFRPGQLDIMLAALAGRDTVGIMPTGSGKSLCFQLPSLLQHKNVLVVSPLISLMQDQHDHLDELHIPSASVNSTLTSREEETIKVQLKGGCSELVYVTPERLENADYLELLKQAGVSLVVIDEAHCISQWGHDFRPAYTNLTSAIKHLGRPPIMALTATATADVTADIMVHLDLKDPLVVRHGIDRPNLIFSVKNTTNEQAKQAALLEIIEANKGVGIVYVATVKAAEQVAQWLVENGVAAAAYHGRLTAKLRESVQDDFMADKFKVIVATKAFGMGIDKPDVRFVVHYQFPDSVESYYQEAGRAGRDGEDANIVLLYQLEDKRIQSFFLGGKYPNRGDVSAFLQALKAASAEHQSLNTQKLAAITGTALNKTRVIANYLESAELIKKTRGLKIVRDFDDDEELGKFLDAYEHRHQTDKERLEQMMHYAQTMNCRVAFLQSYFGESDTAKCGRCDNCHFEHADITNSESKQAA